MKLNKKLLVLAVVSAQILFVAFKIASAADKAKRISLIDPKHFTVRVHSYTAIEADTVKLEAAVGEKVSRILGKKLDAKVKIVTTDDEKKAPAGAFEGLGLIQHPDSKVLMAEIVVLPNGYELALEFRLSQIQIDQNSDAFEPQFKTRWRITERAQTPNVKANKTIDKLIETAMEKYLTDAEKKGFF